MLCSGNHEIEIMGDMFFVERLWKFTENNHLSLESPRRGFPPWGLVMTTYQGAASSVPAIGEHVEETLE